MAELTQLVSQHVIESHWNEKLGVMTREIIDWIAIADKLNRVPQDCNDKWYLKDKKLRKGPFTTEEDALIKERVAEWGNKGNRLWVSLEKEIGRPAHIISKYWRRHLTLQCPNP